MTVVSYLEFRSSIDRIFAWLILGTCFLLLTLGVFVLTSESTDSITQLLVFLTVAGVMPVMLWILFGTRYRLTETHLLVRSGPFYQKIILNTITSIEPVHSLQSGHALARDRFLVCYEQYATVMISPEDRGRFLQEITLRVPHLVWQDEKLVTYS